MLDDDHRFQRMLIVVIVVMLVSWGALLIAASGVGIF